MRTSFVLLLTVIAALKASGQQPANEVWSELKAKRAALSGLHQEFEVSQTFLTDNSSKGWYQRLFIDISQKQWREQYSSGSIDRIRVFDGENLFLMEAGGNEYVRVKKPSKNSDPEPEPYGGYILDWTKAQEVGRRPCGFSKHDHPCLIIDVPVKGWVHLKNASQKERLVSGVNRVTIYTDTGAVVLSDSMEVIDNGRGEYKLHRTYVLK